MELNEQDGGNRKYICVQLDEQIDEKTEAFNAGYTKISDITQARIEKVIQKIQKERLDNPNTDTQKQNLGFRKCTLSTSNFKEWIEDIQDTSQLEQQMLLNEVAQMPNSDIYHILWELMLKQGLGLDSQIQTINIDNSNFYYTNNIVFVLEKYNNNIHQAILKLKPQKVIALDSAFSDDNVKTNASLKFEDENIDFESI
jgi:adenine-specific DNA-methyltransferase